MIAGCLRHTLRACLEGALPPEADTAFTAHILRFLGVPNGEATAIAG